MQDDQNVMLASMTTVSVRIGQHSGTVKTALNPL